MSRNRWMSTCFLIGLAFQVFGKQAYSTNLELDVESPQELESPSSDNATTPWYRSRRVKIASSVFATVAISGITYGVIDRIHEHRHKTDEPELVVDYGLWRGNDTIFNSSSQNATLEPTFFEWVNDSSASNTYHNGNG